MDALEALKVSHEELRLSHTLAKVVQHRAMAWITQEPSPAVAEQLALWAVIQGQLLTLLWLEGRGKPWQVQCPRPDCPGAAGGVDAMTRMFPEDWAHWDTADLVRLRAAIEAELDRREEVAYVEAQRATWAAKCRGTPEEDKHASQK